MWQAGGGFDRNLTEWDRIHKGIEYIEWNPVRRGLVVDPVQWEWSSAQARAGLANVPLPIDSVDSVFRVDGDALSKP